MLNVINYYKIGLEEEEGNWPKTVVLLQIQRVIKWGKMNEILGHSNRSIAARPQKGIIFLQVL